MNKTLTKPKQKLDLGAILKADPVPDEPMTLKELHDLNGGFPFKARRVAIGEKQGSPVGSVHEFISEVDPDNDIVGTDGRLWDWRKDVDWSHCYIMSMETSVPSSKSQCGRHLNNRCACWTFAD